MRKLASIQRVTEIHELPQFDNINLARVLGWSCLVKKTDFKVGDLAVYFEIDSICPMEDPFMFLQTRHFKIKTLKMKGVISQGLLMPISEFRKLDGQTLFEGMDVTEILGIKRIEECPTTRGELECRFPASISKTDELRIQTCPGVIERNKEVPCFISEKIDGSSGTFYFLDGEYGVCSRNFKLKRSDCCYWNISDKYDIENNMRLRHEILSLQDKNSNIVIQGEIVGPRIQGNKYKLDNQKFYVHNVQLWDNFNKCMRHGTIIEMLEICREFKLDTVPRLKYDLDILNITNPYDNYIDFLVDLSKGNSVLNSSVKREGIVIRSIDNHWDSHIGRLSFKVINPEFLLKYGI
jgi:RNA ligase (TIGR02306 family)